MSSFLATSIAPRVDLYLLRRDYFDGMGLLLQTVSGTPYDLNGVQVCASAWKITASGTYEKILDINVEEKEPLRNGQIRLWLTSAQTAALWDAYNASVAGSTNVFFPNAYSDQIQANSIQWDVRIESQEYLSNLLSVANGVFTTQTNHTLASSERVVFSGTTSSGINFNGTAATVYSGLTNISYLAPYSFRIPSLSGVTSSGIGGAVYRLKQDTVITGNIVVGTTLSNCFP